MLIIYSKSDFSTNLLALCRQRMCSCVVMEQEAISMTVLADIDNFK